jgi:hypothetical protein
MRAKLVEENIKDILKPKSDEEIEKDWPQNSRASYKLVKRTKDELEKLGVNVKKISGYSADFDISGFLIFRASSSVMRVLTKEDAEQVVEALKKVDYKKDVYEIQEENIYLSFNEARNYISKKMYNMKEYPERGKTNYM